MPLIIGASNNQNPDVVKALIGEGANINSKDDDGWTSVMHAADLNRNADVTKVLLSARAE